MLYDDLVQPGEYICHYGVKGMRWGVRHEENKRARALGRAATSLRYADNISKRNLSSAQKRYDKKPSNKNRFKLTVAKEVEKRLSKLAKSSLDELNDHYESLVKKYGQEHVKDIKYDKNGNINDYSRGQVVAGTVGGIAMAVGMAMAMANFVGGPAVGVGVNPYPSPSSVGSRIYGAMYTQVTKELERERELTRQYLARNPDKIEI